MEDGRWKMEDGRPTTDDRRPTTDGTDRQRPAARVERRAFAVLPASGFRLTASGPSFPASSVARRTLSRPAPRPFAFAEWRASIGLRPQGSWRHRIAAHPTPRSGSPAPAWLL